MRFKPRVLLATAHHVLTWRGTTLFPGMFDGEHTFIIESLNDGSSRLLQREKFTGVLTYLMKRRFWQQVETAFNNMNDALASEADKRYPSS